MAAVGVVLVFCHLKSENTFLRNSMFDLLPYIS